MTPSGPSWSWPSSRAPSAAASAATRCRPCRGRRRPSPASRISQRGDELEARGIAPRTTTVGRAAVRVRGRADPGREGRRPRQGRPRPARAGRARRDVPRDVAAATGGHCPARRRAVRVSRTALEPDGARGSHDQDPAGPAHGRRGQPGSGRRRARHGPAGPGRVYRKKAEGGAYDAPLDPRPTTAAGFRDTSVAAGESWCYVVRAVAGTDPLVESASSSEACVSVRDVFAPASPTGVAALAAGGVVDVSWSPSTEADLASYRVYRSDGGEPERLAEVPGAETRFRDEKAAAGASYDVHRHRRRQGRQRERALPGREGAAPVKYYRVLTPTGPAWAREDGELPAAPLRPRPGPTTDGPSTRRSRPTRPACSLPRSRLARSWRSASTIATTRQERGKPIPAEPLLFLKPPSAVIGPGETIRRPAWAGRVDHEAELGHRDRAEGARTAFARKPRPRTSSASICVNDVTARELQDKDVQFTRAQGLRHVLPDRPLPGDRPRPGRARGRRAA